MDEAKVEERRLVAARLEIVRGELLATGATVLSPTAEWTALRREMLDLNKQLK